MTLLKIISGGQTGADQGALDGARMCNFPYGGAVPAGRRTEAGPLPVDYQMEELPSAHYPVRTRKNVEDADGTLIVSHGQLTGGSLLTRQIAEENGRPCIHIDFTRNNHNSALKTVREWLNKWSIQVLNVAGPRQSSDPAIYDRTRRLVIDLLSGYGTNVR